MYQQMQQFLHDGGSLLNLGGNSVYERGAYALGQTGMVFHGGQDAFEKGSDDRNYQRLRYENLFRSTNSTQERPLLGVATERCAVQGAGYTIREAGHPLFDGTGLGNGSVIGVEGLTDNGPGTIDSGLGASDGGSTYNGGATGWEVDSMNGPGATGLPDRCQMNLVEDSRPPGHNTPLAAGQVELARSRNTDQADPSVSFDGASMTYYEHPSGGVVYSVGSVTFGGSLIVDPHLSTIVSNVLTKALE
jgi:hypothetical protein